MVRLFLGERKRGGWGLKLGGIGKGWVHVQLCKACSEFVVNSRWFFLEGEKGEARQSEGGRLSWGEGVLGRCFHSRFC